MHKKSFLLALSALACIAKAQMVPFVPGYTQLNSAVEYNKLATAAESKWREVAMVDGELDALPSTQILVTYLKRDRDGKLTVLDQGVSLQARDYQVVLQWVKYRQHVSDDGRTVFFGVGGRAFGSLKVRKAGINALIGALFFGSNTTSTQGRVEIQKFGITGAPVDSIVTIGSVDLSQENIGQMMVQFATLFSKVRDAGVKIRPEILAVDQRTAKDLGIIKP